MKQKMADRINWQMNREMYSAYLYLSMAAYFDSLGMKGFAHWMKAQVSEEVTHALKFYFYLVQEGARAEMENIEAPPKEWESPIAVFEHVLKHEKMVTGLINDLVKVSVEQKEENTTRFLQWYVKEQVEEEESAGNAVEKLKSAGSDKAKLAALDAEFAARVIKTPKF